MILWNVAKYVVYSLNYMFQVKISLIKNYITDYFWGFHLPETANIFNSEDAFNLLNRALWRNVSSGWFL